MNRRGFLAGLGALAGAVAARALGVYPIAHADDTTWQTGAEAFDFSSDTMRVAVVDPYPVRYIDELSPPVTFDTVEKVIGGRRVKVPRLRGDCEAVWRGESEGI
jgi:hypothetical protein